MKRRLPVSSGDKKLDSTMEQAINVPVDVTPTLNEAGTDYVFGILTGISTEAGLAGVLATRNKIALVTVTFNLAADTEVVVTNPLGVIPELCIQASIENQARANVYQGDTWTASELGFKCEADTTPLAMTVHFLIL